MSRVAFQPWLEERVLRGDWLAAAVRGQDRTVETVSRSPEFPETSLPELFSFVSEFDRVATQQKLPAAWQCWSFQSARLVFTVRPDGVALAALLAPDASLEGLDALLADFRNWGETSAT